MIVLCVLVFVYFLHLLLKMSWSATAVVLVFLLAMLPVHIKKYKQMKRQEGRFEDVCLYMDTLLYAFSKEMKIDRALEDVEQVLLEGDMKNKIREVLHHIHMTFDETEVISKALSIFEEEYPCRRITNIHTFMMHVENYGGEIERSVNLLLEDKSKWERRTKAAMLERNKLWVNVALSVLVSLVICGIIMYLPVEQVEISEHIVTQVLSVVVIVLDDFILLRGQNYLAQDWLMLEHTQSDEYFEKKMDEFLAYDESKSRRTSMVLAGIALIPTILCFWIMGSWQGLVGLVVCLVFLNQHNIGRALAKKNLIKAIRWEFPNWMIDLALLLQTENVQMALEKSKEQVPGLLKKHLERMLAQLQMEPESSAPFHSFMKEFAIPEVHSAMSMLYSISAGNCSNADKQIEELISKNQEMMDEAQKSVLKDKNSGLYLLFLSPVLSSSIKLVADMAIFMIRFLAIAAV